MSVLATSPTTDPWDISSTFPEKVRRVSRSSVVVDLLDDRIRSVLDSWEQSKSAPLGRWAAVPAFHAAERPFPVAPVDAVQYVCDVLQISHDAVLRGTGVSESSCYRWKREPDQEPRPKSLGRLWPTVRSLSLLENAHPNLAAWYHSTPDAQEAFEAGRLNRLLQLEFEWLQANSAGRANLTSTSVEMPWFGEGPNLEVLGSVEDVAADTGAAPLPLKSKAHRVARRKPTNPADRG